LIPWDYLWTEQGRTGEGEGDGIRRSRRQTRRRKNTGVCDAEQGKKARLVSGKQSQYRAVGENYSDERGRWLSCQLAVEGRREREEGKKKEKEKNIKNDNNIQYQ
jgi:hypothetical protein